MASASLHGTTIVVSNDLVRSLTGKIDYGYRVSLHAIPSRDFLIEARDGEEAVRVALAVAASNGIKPRNTGATFQAI